MVANNGALGPQPDFDIMADHLSEIAEHIRRCSNIPTVQGNKVILQAITEMRSELRRDIAELRTELRRDINELRTEHLSPLHSLLSNQQIPDFPETLSDIDALGAHPLDALLNHLDVPSPPTVAEKRAAFKKAIGVLEMRKRRRTGSWRLVGHGSIAHRL
ncbi:hypothetical protein GTA08_BOTSDO12640 [Botryosphaeria dothidea]|uniref:Uncharacterized protein n=1 Tax=Botryosphaeria dothidea TaxID=55169 RepID=A0A8H4J2L8_9PEZI|nr:hypothetical protein GTA08_BOTSDO14022 [Botryosphaeria dothidea]KAF4311897.1 hypothetical protein GTA08_BOTSDO12640 [Botryosphaeria dothidea]